MRDAEELGCFSEITRLYNGTKLTEAIGFHMEPMIENVSVFVNQIEWYYREVKKFSRLISKSLKSTDALAVFAQIRSKFKGRAVAFFRTSEAIEGGFRPHLSIIGLDPEEILQSKNGQIEIEQNGKTEIRFPPNCFNFCKLIC